MLELDRNTLESSDLVEQTFSFWFNDSDHIRSPFPEYIRKELKLKATEQFFDWASTLDPKAKDEVNDEVVGEKFEAIIFEIASTLVMTDDEKITIQYPFLPRLGDVIYENAETKEGESAITDRGLIKDGDTTFLKIYLKKIENGDTWETKFELPE